MAISTLSEIEEFTTAKNNKFTLAISLERAGAVATAAQFFQQAARDEVALSEAWLSRREPVMQAACLLSGAGCYAKTSEPDNGLPLLAIIEDDIVGLPDFIYEEARNLRAKLLAESGRK